MATVTVYTAERMKAIEDASIVSGAIVGNDLILTKFDETTINAGVVKGDKGDTGATGAPGEVSTADMNAAIAALKSSVYGAVNHGADENVARPTGFAGVIWFGTVQPLNMTNPDIVIRTDEAI